jgi:hypothetical protein
MRWRSLCGSWSSAATPPEAVARFLDSEQLGTGLISPQDNKDNIWRSFVMGLMEPNDADNGPEVWVVKVVTSSEKCLASHAVVTAHLRSQPDFNAAELDAELSSSQKMLTCSEHIIMRVRGKPPNQMAAGLLPRHHQLADEIPPVVVSRVLAYFFLKRCSSAATLALCSIHKATVLEDERLIMESNMTTATLMAELASRS